jgi:SPP1 family predicted phage head-tail adaptor
MRAGQLNKRVQLQRATTTRDASGGMVDTWASYATIWAGFLDLSSREAYRARQVNAEVTHAIQIRYRPDVRFTDRLLYGSLILEIVGIEDEQQRHVSMLLTCKEVK